MHTCIHACMHADRQAGRQATGRQTGRQTDRQADRQADRQTGRQADRQTGRQAGRQTDRRLCSVYTGVYVQSDPVEHSYTDNRLFGNPLAVMGVVIKRWRARYLHPRGPNVRPFIIERPDIISERRL